MQLWLFLCGQNEMLVVEKDPRSCLHHDTMATIPQYHLPHLLFTALDPMHPDHQQGNWDKLVLPRELLWIHKLKAAEAPGFN